MLCGTKMRSQRKERGIPIRSQMTAELVVRVSLMPNPPSRPPSRKAATHPTQQSWKAEGCRHASLNALVLNKLHVGRCLGKCISIRLYLLNRRVLLLLRRLSSYCCCYCHCFHCCWCCCRYWLQLLYRHHYHQRCQQQHFYK